MKPFMDQAKPMQGPQENTEGEPAQAVEEPENAAGQPQGGFKSPVNKALPPELQPVFERVVIAGQKIMYSEQMKPEIDKLMAESKPIEQKLAEGVARLMAVVVQQAKNMPPQVIMPAAIELVYDAADFVQESGLAQVTDDQKKAAAQYVVVLLAKGAGASDEQVMGMFGGQGAQDTQGQGMSGQGAPQGMPQQDMQGMQQGTPMMQRAAAS